MALAAVSFYCDSIFHGLAGGVFISRVAAKYAVAVQQERLGRMVDRVGSVRILAHHEHGLSELALCNPRLRCRNLLWLDLAEKQFDICFRDRSCAGRYYLALFLSHVLTEAPRSMWGASGQRRFLLSFWATRAFTNFLISAVGRDLFVGNWIVPLDVEKGLSSFLNFSIIAAVGNKLQFFFKGSGDHRDLHSFPTRRSSDLDPPRPRGATYVDSTDARVEFTQALDPTAPFDTS